MWRGKIKVFLKENIIGIVLLYALSIFTAICDHVCLYYDYPAEEFIYRVRLLLKANAYFILLLLIYFVLIFLKKRAEQSDNSFGFLKWRVKDIILATIILFAVYMLYLYCYYPGLSNHDTSVMIYDYITGDQPIPFIAYLVTSKPIEAWLNASNPLIDTLIFSGFYNIGVSLGSPNIGVFLYCGTQALLTSFAFSLMICSISLWNRKSDIFRILGFIYLILAPFVPLYVINMLKDSLNGAFFIIYYVFFVLIIKYKNVFGEERKLPIRYWIILIITALMVVLTRKTGVFTIIVAGTALFFIKSLRVKKYMGFLIAHIALPVLVSYVLLPYVIYPAFDIYSGGKQEGMGIMMQQVAHTYVEAEEDFSKKDREIIDAVMDINTAVEKYSWVLVDPVKDTYKIDATDKQLSDFKKLWIAKGFNHPSLYLEAIIGVNGGYLCPTYAVSVYDPVAQMYVYPGIDENNEIGIEDDHRVDQYRDTVREFYYWLNYVPGLNIFMYMVLYAWWVPLFVIYILIKNRDWNSFVCMLPILVAVVGLFMSPYASTRYIIPQFYSLPMFISFISCFSKGEVKL